MSSSTGRARLSSVIIKCAVSPARSRAPRSTFKRQEIVATPNSGNTVYVGRLAKGTKCTELHKHFSSVGKVKRCNTVRDHHTNRFLGYGFVTMETEEEAELCIKYLNDSIIRGLFITVKKAKRSFAGRVYAERKRARRRQKRDYYSRDRRWRRSCSPYKNRKRMDDYSSSSPDKKRKRVNNCSSSSPDQKRKRVDAYSSCSPYQKRKRTRVR